MYWCSGCCREARPIREKGMHRMDREMTKQVVVRMDYDLYEALERDAVENERTISQTVRHKLRELVPARG